MAILLGIVGAWQSGKDTLGRLLVKEYNFQQLAIADKIKNEYFSLINYSNNQFELDKGTEKELEIRNSLWKYSDNIKKEKGKDYFINLLLDNFNNDINTVITDIRTMIELNKVRSFGFKIGLVIDRPFKLDEKIPGSRLFWKDIKPLIYFYNVCTLNDFKLNIRGKLKREFDI